MNYKGNDYEDRINVLKKLKLSDKPAYKKLLDETQKSHKISVKTIYRDMRKKVPGLRKTRNDSGKMRTPIIPFQQRITNEMITNGQTLEQTKKVIESKTGKSVSARRMHQMHEKATVNDSAETVFGDKYRELVEQMFEYHLIAPERSITLEYNGIKFTLKKKDLGDIILVVANAYNRSDYAAKHKLDLDRDELRRSIVLHLIEQQMRLAGECADYKMVESLTRMLDRMQTEFTTDANFETLLKVCKQLKPDVSKEEIIHLVKKVSE